MRLIPTLTDSAAIDNNLYRAKLHNTYRISTQPSFHQLKQSCLNRTFSQRPDHRTCPRTGLRNRLFARSFLAALPLPQAQSRHTSNRERPERPELDDRQRQRQRKGAPFATTKIRDRSDEFAAVGACKRSWYRSARNAEQ